MEYFEYYNQYSAKRILSWKESSPMSKSTRTLQHLPPPFVIISILYRYYYLCISRFPNIQYLNHTSFMRIIVTLVKTRSMTYLYSILVSHAINRQKATTEFDIRTKLPGAMGKKPYILLFKISGEILFILLHKYSQICLEKRLPPIGK